MANTVHMQASFTPDAWTALNDRGNKVNIGSRPDEFAPYDLLLAGLEGCLFSTFNDVIQKMRLTYESAEMEVSGVKRDADVATLETCTVEMRIRGGSDVTKLERAFDIATRYCSVYQTISQVAEMKSLVTFA
jgi:putative redox protein